MGFFNGESSPEEREELSPEERIALLEESVEILSKSEETLQGAVMLALSQINTLILALQEKGVVKIGELEKERVKTLKALKRIERAKDNGG